MDFTALEALSTIASAAQPQVGSGGQGLEAELHKKDAVIAQLNDRIGHLEAQLVHKPGHSGTPRVSLSSLHQTLFASRESKQQQHHPASATPASGRKKQAKKVRVPVKRVQSASPGRSNRSSRVRSPTHKIEQAGDPAQGQGQQPNSPQQVPMTMTAATVSSSQSSPLSSKSGSRYWTPTEHQRFLQALDLYGKNAIREISDFVKTRTPTQVRTHSQKYFASLEKTRGKAATSSTDLSIGLRKTKTNLAAIASVDSVADPTPFSLPATAATANQNSDETESMSDDTTGSSSPVLSSTQYVQQSQLVQGQGQQPMEDISAQTAATQVAIPGTDQLSPAAAFRALSLSPTSTVG